LLADGTSFSAHDVLNSDALNPMFCPVLMLEELSERLRVSAAAEAVTHETAVVCWVDVVLVALVVRLGAKVTMASEAARAAAIQSQNNGSRSISEGENGRAAGDRMAR
jgi:hypothetical protein